LEKQQNNNATITNNYAFIDSLRFISMISIVMEHCGNYFGVQNYPHLLQKIAAVANVDLYKFGTIIFFLLSGFLIGDKIKTTTPFEYIKRRFKSTIKPWLFWVFIFIFLNYLTSALIYFKFHPSDFWQTPTLPITYQISHTVFFTSFWFILNFMICLAVLLTFRKHLDSFYFGGILLFLSLFYSVNVYTEWIPTSHTIAFLGFVFYLWLGYTLNRYFNEFKSRVAKFPGWILIGLLVLTFAASCGESFMLISLKSEDAFNTLRISNIFVSLISFLVLFKYSDSLNVSALKPRQTTYGIYLIHQVLIVHLIPLVVVPLHYQENIHSIETLVVMQMLRFFVIYGFSYGIALALTYAPKGVRWVVGQ
jgi:hypothetical protein